MFPCAYPPSRPLGFLNGHSVHPITPAGLAFLGLCARICRSVPASPLASAVPNCTHRTPTSNPILNSLALRCQNRATGFRQRLGHTRAAPDAPRRVLGPSTAFPTAGRQPVTARAGRWPVCRSRWRAPGRGAPCRDVPQTLGQPEQGPEHGAADPALQQAEVRESGGSAARRGTVLSNTRRVGRPSRQPAPTTQWTALTRNRTFLSGHLKTGHRRSPENRP